MSLITTEIDPHAALAEARAAAESARAALAQTTAARDAEIEAAKAEIEAATKREQEAAAVIARGNSELMRRERLALAIDRRLEAAKKFQAAITEAQAALDALRATGKEIAANKGTGLLFDYWINVSRHVPRATDIYAAHINDVADFERCIHKPDPIR